MSIEDRPILPRRFLRAPYYRVITGAAGEPGTAVFVTPDEEDRYIHSVARAAQSLEDTIPARYNITPQTFATQKASGDPFWQDDANVRRYGTVWDFTKWKVELDQHVEQWDKRTIVDKAGRFIVGTIVGVYVPPAGTAIRYTVNDWSERTSRFDQELRAWAKRFVAEGITPEAKVPSDLIERPQSVLSADDPLGVKKAAAAAGQTFLDALKPLIVVGVIGLTVIVAVNVVPPLLAARAARKAAGG